MENEKQKYNVADYVAEFFVQIGCNKIHGLMGGGAAGLNDAFIRNTNIDYHCYHHEQSAGYAALGEARVTKIWSALNPTTGCGGANCYTPVLNAWQDSLPLVIISGNVNLSTCSQFLKSSENLDLRAYGVQEHDIINSVKSVTKYAKLVEQASDIELFMKEAFVFAASGRKGPSWIDIPADIQHAEVTEGMFKKIPENVSSVYTTLKKISDDLNASADFSEILLQLSESKRPLVLVGGGVSNDIEVKALVKKFIRDKGLPVVATYAGTDVIDHEYNMYLGAIGIKGNRAANFAVQNSDLLIVLGSRLPFAAIGYDVSNFAKNATICVVDPDVSEINKNDLNFSSRIIQVNGSACEFVRAAKNINLKPEVRWKSNCIEIKKKWEIITENKNTFNYNGISIYHVMEELNRHHYDDCNFVVDAGSISYVAPTALKYSSTRNFAFSPGQADMGCALPSALGVSATSDKRTICVTGDGSFMSNLQELASLAHHNYNMTVLVLNNSGYLSITNTQRNNYGENRVFGEHEGRGLKFPDYEKICDAFSLKFFRIKFLNELSKISDSTIKVIQIDCLQLETIAPYQARVGGKQAGAHDMAPFRDKKELQEYSSVKLNFAR